MTEHRRSRCFITWHQGALLCRQPAVKRFRYWTGRSGKSSPAACVSVPSDRHPFTYVLPGDGEFPVAPLMEQLRKDYADVVSLEWEKFWHPYLPSLEDALATAGERAWW